MKKKVLSVVLCMAMVAAMLTACGDSAEAPAATETVEAPAEEETPAEEAASEVAASEEAASEEEAPAEEPAEEEAVDFDVDKVMASIVDYFTANASEDNKGEYTVFDTENVDNGDTIDFIVRYCPSDEEEDEMIENGSGPVANVYVATVTVTKATMEAVDESGNKIALDGSADENVAASGDFSFADIAAKGFVFTSGVGAWQTSLGIDKDGNFEGLFSDSNMGETGDDYPEGTRYYCQFDGKFTAPVKVSDYEYDFEIESIDTHEPAEKETIKDGFRTVFSDPYGLEESKKFCIYLPGTPVKDIPEEIQTWIFMFGEGADAETIDFYAIGNLDKQYGFIEE